MARKRKRPEQPPAAYRESGFDGNFSCSWNNEQVPEFMVGLHQVECEQSKALPFDLMVNTELELNIDTQITDLHAAGKLQIPFEDVPEKEYGKIVTALGIWQVTVGGTDGERRTITKALLDEVMLRKRKALLIETVVNNYPSPQSKALRWYFRKGGRWRMRDLLTAVVDSERYVRPNSDLFGTCDVSHIFLQQALFCPSTGKLSVCFIA